MVGERYYFHYNYVTWPGEAFAWTYLRVCRLFHKVQGEVELAQVGQEQELELELEVEVELELKLELEVVDDEMHAVVQSHFAHHNQCPLSSSSIFSLFACISFNWFARSIIITIGRALETIEPKACSMVSQLYSQAN